MVEKFCEKINNLEWTKVEKFYEKIRNLILGFYRHEVGEIGLYFVTDKVTTHFDVFSSFVETSLEAM